MVTVVLLQDVRAEFCLVLMLHFYVIAILFFLQLAQSVGQFFCCCFFYGFLITPVAVVLFALLAIVELLLCLLLAVLARC